VNPAYSVILFTTASGAGYGLLALLGVVGFNHGVASSPGFALTSLFVALALITTGLLSSTLHLGHPERAWRALSQWQTSWLSREGVAAVATYPFALAFGAVWSGIVDLPQLIPHLGIMTALLCLVTVYCTGKIYSTLKTIRQWHRRDVVLIYFLFALATGSTLLAVITYFFDRSQVFLDVLAGIFVGTAVSLKSGYWHSIDNDEPSITMGDATGLGEDVRQWEEPHTNMNFIQKEMGFVVARHHVKKLRFLVELWLIAAMILLLISSVGDAHALVLLAAPLVFAATVFERWLFFAEAQHVVNLYYGADRR
jgi:sulfite dehydrogenase (quinone) subunit SoeC